MSNLPAVVRPTGGPVRDLAGSADRQTQVNLLERHQSRTIGFGWLVVLLFFGVLMGWAAFMPLSGAVITNGELVVSGSNKPVQHYGGGIITEILVSDGDVVEKGQVLLRLDPTDTEASAEVSAARYFAMLAQEARLIAERDGRESIPWPEALLEHRNDPEVATFMDAQETVFEARRTALAGQKSILGERIAQLREEITGLKAEITGVEQQLALIAEETQTVRQLVAEGLAVKSRLLALQRQQASLVGRKGNLESAVARAEQRINETRLQLENMQDRTYAEVVEELKNVRSTLKDLREKRKVAAARAERAAVRAPVAGTVQGMEVTGVGEVIGNGQLLMEIVPKDQPMVASVRIKPRYIDEVQVGQAAEVKLTIYNFRTFSKKIDGRVSFVAVDSTQPESYAEMQRYPQGYYKAKVEIDQDDIERYARTDNIKLFPGAPVTVIIPVEDRTALEFFLGPILMGLDEAFREP